MTENTQSETVNVEYCPRDAASHDSLTFFPLTNPQEWAGGAWASCPGTQQPVMRSEVVVAVAV
ncbi:MAG: hypothetical protein JWO56_2538 [Acidobacteria bacterium]|nr:hypothetical protein [Acidobacteriota bacterium]